MIPYNKKHFTIFTLIKSFFILRPKEKLIDFFREYTGKKFILITASCRSALYLTYKAISKPGEIITSPLTCRSAVDPIIAAGYSPVFQDIDPDILTMSDYQLEEKINLNTRGIQLIHTGGFCCEPGSVSEIAGRNGIFIVEDCAQGLFSVVDGKKAGTIGDFVCFSLLKNAKGIGGGILATDDESVFRKAEEIQNGFKKTGFGIIIFRIIRNILEDNRKTYFINKMYVWLIGLRKLSPSMDLSSDGSERTLKLARPSAFEVKLDLIQLKKAIKLKALRTRKGLLFLDMLKEAGLSCNYKNINRYEPSFVKLYIVSGEISSNTHIRALNEMGIEAMHLEHRHGIFFQEPLEKDLKDYPGNGIDTCKVYHNIHNHIISLPFHEDMTRKEMVNIILGLKVLINQAK